LKLIAYSYYDAASRVVGTVRRTQLFGRICQNNVKNSGAICIEENRTKLFLETENAVVTL
jgi:hypothetical protein